MRKRQAVRPVLESMEDRLVLSVAGTVPHAAEVVSARTARVEALAAHRATAHRAGTEAVTHHHHASRTAHPVHHSGSTSKSSSSTNSFSNFFKSVFPGL